MNRPGSRAVRARGARRIGGEEITRILSRGGMVVERGGELCVFRTGDQRRMCIGIVRPGTMEPLEAVGAVRREDGAKPRYVAGVSR
ncbi:MAG: hypothetical protein ACK4HR_07040 [Hyphomonas sp.]|jgi:hypothetical protein